MNGIYGCQVSDLLEWLENFNFGDVLYIHGASLIGTSTKIDQGCAIEINTVADSGEGGTEEEKSDAKL